MDLAESEGGWPSYNTATMAFSLILMPYKCKGEGGELVGERPLRSRPMQPSYSAANLVQGRPRP